DEERTADAHQGPGVLQRGVLDQALQGSVFGAVDRPGGAVEHEGRLAVARGDVRAVRVAERDRALAELQGVAGQGPLGRLAEGDRDDVGLAGLDRWGRRLAEVEGGGGDIAAGCGRR